MKENARTKGTLFSERRARSSPGRIQRGEGFRAAGSMNRMRGGSSLSKGAATASGIGT